MKIKHIDDIHTEFHRDQGLDFVTSIVNPGDVDVLTLGGDIKTAKDTCDRLKPFTDEFPHVVYVLGNHDYYGGSAQQVHDDIREWVETNHVSNFYFLHNESKKIDNVTFHGTTLWVPNPGPGAHQIISRRMNDFVQITDLIKDPYWLYKQNEDAVLFLADNIKEGDVVVTHHLPSAQLISPEYGGSDTNCAYHDNLDNLILRTKPKLWLHGHSHTSAQIKIGDTLCVRNPYGYFVDEYWSQTNSNFDYDLVLDA